MNSWNSTALIRYVILFVYYFFSLFYTLCTRVQASHVLSWIPKVLVIIDVKPKDLGLPTEAYISVEEVHDVSSFWSSILSHINIFDSSHADCWRLFFAEGWNSHI